MTVMPNALLNNVANITNNDRATISNIEAGGQLGIGPHLPNIDASTPLVFNPVVPIITHIPTMFRNIPHMGAILKSLVERHAKAITGIDFGYELGEGSGYVMADSQEAKMPTKTTRTAISPNMTFAEIQGNLVWNFIRTWMSLISHPDTHASKLASMANNSDIAPFIYSYFSMDMLFIQFDNTMLPENIIDAFFVSTMFPKTTGTLNAKREIGTADTIERSIDFNGIVQHNNNTFQSGKAIAELLGLHRANYDYATPIATSIESSAQDLGTQEEISEIVAEMST